MAITKMPNGDLVVGRIYEDWHSRTELRWFDGPYLETKSSLALVISQIDVEPNIP